MNNHEIIDINPSGDIAFTTSLTSFLHALNPFGAIAQIVGKIIACRIQMKKMQTNADIIKKDYDTRKIIIEGAVKYSIEQIELQRIGIKEFFSHASKQLELTKIDNSTRQLVMKEMLKITRDPKVNLDEKLLAHETIREMSGDLVRASEANSFSLASLIEASNKHLMSIPSLAGLLPPPTDRED